MVGSRPLLVTLLAATLALGTAAGASPVLAGPAAAAEASGTAPTVRAGSLDVVGWDDQLVGEAKPELSWVLDDSDRGEAQTAYQVQVTDDRGTTVWDSGKLASASTTLRPYAGPALASGATYTWRVRAWDREDLASDWSAPSTLHTGLLSQDDWKADWISVTSADEARTDFSVGTSIQRAVLYYAAVGNIRATVNGEAVSDEALGTTWTDWDKRVLYRGADVTDLLRQGDNALGVTVGATLSAPTPDIKVMAQLEVTDSSGERHVVATTDDGWRTADSPITRLDTYRGESYDARQRTAGWDEPGFDDAAWKPATVVAPVVGTPLLSGGAPVTAQDSITANGWSPSAIVDGILTSTDSSQGYHSATTNTPDATKWVQLDLGSSRPIGSVTLYGAMPTNDPAGSFPGTGFPVRYKVETSQTADFASPTTIVDHTDADQPNPGLASVEIPADVTGRYVRITATKLAASSGSYSFRLAEVQVRGTEDQRDWAVSPLEPDPTPLTRAVADIAPVKVTTVAAGVQQYDFGQNYAGWVRITATAPAGTTATMYLGEILDGNGRVSTSNINFAPGEEQRQTYRYTFAGTGEETWAPMFVFSGFRYAELSGLPAGTQVSLVAQPVHTDLQRQSTLDLGDAQLSAIDTAVRQGQLNAMHGIPEDTPTREKKGWTGDALAGVSSIMTAFGSDDLYRKYLRDIQTSQYDDGGVASIAPARQFGREFKVDPAWGSAYPGIVWEDYLQEGDRRVLAQHYPDLQRWLAYEATITDADHIIVNPEVTYGEDWQATISTPPRLFHTLYYLEDVRTTADIARVLGHDDDAATLDALAAQIAAGVNRTFLDTDAASYANGTQFANAFPLLLDIVPAALRSKVADNLVKNVRANGDHLTSGFAGTQIVVQALHAIGRDDVILDTALRNDYPSLGYMIANGPGTIWEKWVNSSASDGTSSKDHPALGGGMEEWFYRGLAGITPVGAGYRQIRFTVPDLPGHDHAAASQETVLGTVAADWTRTGDDLTEKVTVPVGATAQVVLPAANTWAVTEGGKLLDDVEGVTSVDAADGTVTVTVGSGTYDFLVSADAGALGRVLDQVRTVRDHVADLADAGDLTTADASHLDDALAAAGADVQTALLATTRDDTAATAAALQSALRRVQDLRGWLATSSIDAPVRSDLDGRLSTLERDLSRVVASALGVTVSLPPVAGAVLPGGAVNGSVTVSDTGQSALTAVSGTVTVDGWDPVTATVATVPAGGSAQLPVTIAVPKGAHPGSFDAQLSLTFTLGGSTYTVTETTADWASVTSGLTIGDVSVTDPTGDPVGTATLQVPVTNSGTSTLRGHVVASLADGWKAAGSAEVAIAPGRTVTASVPVLVSTDRVGSVATAATVTVQHAGVTLASTDTSVSLAVTTPPTGASTDHVDWGDAASETAHQLQASSASGSGSEAGLTRRYTTTTAGQYFSATVDVPAGKPFILRNIDTFDTARTKKYDVSVDGVVVKSQVVPRTETGPGTKAYDLLVDDPAVVAANDGNVRIRFEYTSTAGGSFDASLADTWVLPAPADDQAPLVSAAVTSGLAGDDGWYRSDIQVGVTAVDDRDDSPAVQTGESSGWQDYAGPVTVSGDGKHTLSYRAGDAAGNTSATQTLPVWIDTAAPTTTLAVTRGTGVQGSDSATLAFTATDALSGVGSTLYRIDGGDWSTLATTPVTIQGYGEHTVDYTSTDVAGNAETVQHTEVSLADVDTITALVAPAVRGTARLGATLTSTTGSWNTKGLTLTRQWLRNGAAVRGATGPTYRISTADIGRRISLRVTATKPGRPAGTATSAATAAVAKATSTSRLALSKAKVRRGKKVTVTATVIAPGLRPTGRVQVLLDGRVTRTLTLAGGRATTKVVVRKGRHRITVRYLGSATVTASTSPTTIVTGR